MEQMKYVVETMGGCKKMPDITSAVDKMFRYLNHHFESERREHEKYHKRDPERYPLIRGHKRIITIEDQPKGQRKFIHETNEKTFELIKRNVETARDIYIQDMLIYGDNNEETEGEITHIQTLKQSEIDDKARIESLQRMLKGYGGDVVARQFDGTIITPTQVIKPIRRQAPAQPEKKKSRFESIDM